MAWSPEELAARFPDAWRLWGTGGTSPDRTAVLPPGPSPRPAPGEPDPPGPPPEPPERPDGPGDPQPAAQSSEKGVLWHRVVRGEDWAALVARYNIHEPRALLEANGLATPHPLVPGEWVCVPCHLVRPVWEIDAGPEEGESSVG